MSATGDSGQLELISQLRGFLRDERPRRQATARVTRLGIAAVECQVIGTGVKLRNIPVADGLDTLKVGSTIFLLYLESNHILGLVCPP
jgi:hypothetical protein